MKKIINPWKGLEGYNCFGCAPDNEAGVRMEFYEDGDEIVSVWKPRPEYQGWIDTLHGGIQAVLLDEICAWTVLRKLQTTGVTSKMETRYRKRMIRKIPMSYCVLLLRKSREILPLLRPDCIIRMENCVRKLSALILLSRRKRRKMKCTFCIAMWNRKRFCL